MEKLCKKCNVVRDISAFSRDIRLKDGYKNECSVCRRTRQNSNKRKKKGCIDKTCPLCNELKAASYYNIDNTTDDKLAHICIECGKDREKVRKGRNKIYYRCSACNQEKSGFYFPFTKHSYTTIYSWCKECLSSHRKEEGVYDSIVIERKEKRHRDKAFSEKLKNAAIIRHHKDPRKRMLWQARKRALSRGIEFNITIEDLSVPEICPILGIPIKCGTKGNYSNTPSLDRKDNNRGYVVGNVQVISMKANTMKNDATAEQLIAFANWINKNIK